MIPEMIDRMSNKTHDTPSDNERQLQQQFHQEQQQTLVEGELQADEPNQEVSNDLIRWQQSLGMIFVSQNSNDITVFSRVLARQGKTIVCTIHQPSSQVCTYTQYNSK